MCRHVVLVTAHRGTNATNTEDIKSVSDERQSHKKNFTEVFFQSDDAQNLESNTKHELNVLDDPNESAMMPKGLMLSPHHKTSLDAPQLPVSYTPQMTNKSRAKGPRPEDSNTHR